MFQIPRLRFPVKRTMNHWMTAVIFARYAQKLLTMRCGMARMMRNAVVSRFRASV